MSTIAATSMSEREWTMRKTFRPIRPKPMMPIRVVKRSLLGTRCRASYGATTPSDTRGAFGTGTGRSQGLERVDSGVVPVAPDDLDRVRPDRNEVPYPYLAARRGRDDAQRIGLDVFLTSAQGAGTIGPQVVERKVRLVAVPPGDGELAPAHRYVPWFER